MRVTAHKLKNRRFSNWHAEVEDHWNYQDMLDDPAWRQEWTSFDCCLYLPESDRLCCGVTSFAGEIFWIYDGGTGAFTDPGYGAIRSPYDAKFHRSLVRSREDGCVYAAIALLHDIDRYWDAPGGAIVRYNPATGELKKLGIPVPHVYIQSICLDDRRRVLYGVTFTPERMIRFDLRTGQSDDLGPISSGFQFTQAESIELDDQGCAWSPWTVTRAWQNTPGPDSRRLCKYDPEAGRVRFFETGLPSADGSGSFEKVDGLFNLGTGDLFATGGNGTVFRVNTETGRARRLFTPVADHPSRLSSLRIGPDGAAWGVVGKQGCCEVIRIDMARESYELLGPVADGGERCWQIHDVAVTPAGTIYACENDNPCRSGFLWEIVP
jgi:sugar lactone lactonase YvrE